MALEEVGITSRGNTIFREPNEVGGHMYWSDSIGGGVCIWDTALASIEELELAIKLEKERLEATKPIEYNHPSWKLYHDNQFQWHRLNRLSAQAYERMMQAAHELEEAGEMELDHR